MFAGIKNGTDLIKECVRAFGKYPRLMIPLLVCWAIYAPVVVHLKFFFPWDGYTTGQQLGVLFLVILLFSFLLSVSCLILLELIQQIETGKSPGILAATFSSISIIGKSLPVTIAWAAIWFVITVIEMLLRRRRNGDNEHIEFNAENVARTVAGFEEFSLSAAFFEALRKGVRMIAFLIYPAIAWENRGISSSMKRGLAVATTHQTEFVAGFVLTELAAVIVFLPPAILFLLSGKFHVEFPEWVWFITIVYCGFAWSFSMFLEQMFTAELYLWHLLWERDCSIAKSNGNEMPKLQDVKRPSIMDNIPDLSNAAEQEKSVS
jgi:preprotein translocase subunit SecG